MGEYVEIRTGVSEIINIANGLRSRGQQLEGGIAGANGEIASREGAETLPRDDDFAEQFVAVYFQKVPGVDGQDVDANVAVRESATKMAAKLTEIGDFVAGGMFAYSAGDDDNATNINNTPRA